MPKLIKVVCKCGKEAERQKFSVEKNIEKNGEYLCSSCSAFKRNADPSYIEKLKSHCGTNHWCYGIPKELNPNYGKKRPESGINISKALNRICDNGLSVAQNGSNLAAITMKSNGTYDENSKKAAITKTLNDSWVSYHTKKYNGLYYRSGLELDFIKRTINIENCHFNITYNYFNKEKHYIPDFYNKEKNIVYEIKSTYTLGLTNKEMFDLNLLKFKSTIQKGYIFYIVLYEEDKTGTIIINKHKYLEPKYYTLEALKEKYENRNFE